jgi:hypothetical protein
MFLCEHVEGDTIEKGQIGKEVRFSEEMPHSVFVTGYVMMWL